SCPSASMSLSRFASPASCLALPGAASADHIIKIMKEYCPFPTGNARCLLQAAGIPAIQQVIDRVWK
ncbi:MAG: hypothetical protein KH295_10055, partial [Clostridiaceae bacterium]|nr:hypothetical protein [Clostridiaceae bacterium]